MTEKTITIYDVSSNEIFEREMTNNELNALEKSALEHENQKNLIDSANAKLAALGLSPEEIAAITGA